MSTLASPVTTLDRAAVATPAGPPRRPSQPTLATYNPERDVLIKATEYRQQRAALQQDQREEDAALQRTARALGLKEQKELLQQRRRIAEMRKFFARFESLRMPRGEEGNERRKSTPQNGMRWNSTPPSLVQGGGDMTQQVKTTGSGPREIKPMASSLGSTRTMITAAQRNTLWNIWNQEQDDRMTEHDEVTWTSSGGGSADSRKNEARHEAQDDEARREGSAGADIEEEDDGGAGRAPRAAARDGTIGETSGSDESAAALRSAAAGAGAAASDAAAIATDRAHVDEIVALKLLVANQQATIDTLSSKLRNPERAYHPPLDCTM